MNDLVLADTASFRDLVTFAARAKRLDPGGAARLVGHGAVLAVYVSPLHGGGGPDVLGLRTFSLAEPSGLDVVVDLQALTDRFARDPYGPRLPVPPAPAAGASWAGVSPPRQGWTPLGQLAAGVLRSAAREGIAEVAGGVPGTAGAAAVARLRAQVWARALPAGPDLAPGAAVPGGAAFAADGLGFLDDEPVAVLAAGPWHRLTTPRGHVLARRPLLG